MPTKYLVTKEEISLNIGRSLRVNAAGTAMEFVNQTIESITGTLVNNTDPSNPIINLMPLKTINGNNINGTGNIPFKSINGVSINGSGNIPFKTINGQSINGTGNISISGGGGSQTLAQTLNNGNSTGTNDIIMTDFTNIILNGSNSIKPTGILIGGYSIVMGTNVMANGGNYMFEMGSGNEIGGYTFTYGSNNINYGDYAFIHGQSNKIGEKITNSTIIAGYNNEIIGGNQNCAIMGTENSAIDYSISNSVALGGSNIIVRQSNSVYISRPVIISDNPPINSNYPGGVVGEISWSNSYIYLKTNNGWKRARLDTF